MVDYYWQRSLSHKQVYGCDTESNVTLKVTSGGCFSLRITVRSAVINQWFTLYLHATPRAHLYT